MVEGATQTTIPVTILAVPSTGTYKNGLIMFEATGDDHPGVRLSCQITVTDKLDGLIVRLPESQS